MKIAIVAKAKQGIIYRHMIENDLSISELAARIGIHYGTMSRIIGFKWLPPQEKGLPGYSLKMKTVYKLQKYFNMSVDVLFPPEITEEIAEHLSKTHVDIREVDLLQIENVNQKYLSYDPQQNDTAELLDSVLTSYLSTLPPRYEMCLRLRYGIGEGVRLDNAQINP